MKSMKKKLLFIFVIISMTLVIGACSKAPQGRATDIPHPIEDKFENCLSCHENGTQGASQTKHPNRENCTDCHKKK